MAQRHKNDDIRTAISQNTKLDGYSDKVPSEIEDRIRLSIDVTPNHNRLTNFFYSFSDTQAAPSHITLDSTRLFFLTGFFISSSSAEISDDSIDVVINGITQRLADNTCIGTTSNCLSMTLLNPLQLDTGSNITFNGGTDNYAFGIYGFYVDPMIYDTGLNTQRTTK